MKKILLLILSLAFLSCNEDSPSQSNNEYQSEIYYRWTENLSYPPPPICSNCSEWCYSLQPFYNNSHPDIPNNAIQGQYYGPLEPGSMFIDLGAAGGGSNTSTLERPADGYRRLYTHKLKEYQEPYNRCIVSYQLSYIDEPIN